MTLPVRRKPQGRALRLGKTRTSNIRPGSMSQTEAPPFVTNVKHQTRLDESDGGPLMADIIPFESRYR